VQVSYQITTSDCRRAAARKPVSDSDPAPERRHVPSGPSIECREVSSPAGKARSAAAAIV
jgi:hypothetical protein